MLYCVTCSTLSSASYRTSVRTLSQLGNRANRNVTHSHNGIAMCGWYHHHHHRQCSGARWHHLWHWCCAWSLPNGVRNSRRVVAGVFKCCEGSHVFILCKLLPDLNFSLFLKTKQVKRWRHLAPTSGNFVPATTVCGSDTAHEGRRQMKEN